MEITIRELKEVLLATKVLLKFLLGKMALYQEVLLLAGPPVALARLVGKVIQILMAVGVETLVLQLDRAGHPRPRPCRRRVPRRFAPCCARRPGSKKDPRAALAR